MKVHRLVSHNRMPRSRTSRIERTAGAPKVLWALAILSSAPTLHAQPTPPAKSEVPLVSLNEVQRILEENSRVTLQFKNALPREIFSEFTRQTNAKVSLREFGPNIPAVDTPVTVDVKDVPFQDAIKALEEQMQVTFNPSPMLGGFEITAGAPGPL
ncbi:MAG: hypothetical protein JWN98_1219, partial [Abditibacteriota bacterium]|nr:hypothetical protein [Abditibacteriota bacterium]